MSKKPPGKTNTLLWNVMRQTGAHNKIQEETEMWKMRSWEIQMSHHKHLSDSQSVKGSMHCDRALDKGGEMGGSGERASEHDDREARYWTRKLYEFEAKDPDRWGHSGFKELYPEEFDSESERNPAKKKTGHHKMKKSKSNTDSGLSKKKMKKSSRKKKKKKKKKEGEGKRKKAECSSSSSSDDSSDEKEKLRRKRTKNRHKSKKSAKKRGRDEDSSSVDSNDEDESGTRSRKKRKQSSYKDSDSGPYSKKKRKNWKAAGEESSDDSSAD